MKIKFFLLPLILCASNGHSTDLFFSVGAGLSKSDTCSSALSSEISAGIKLTNQFSAQITHTDLGSCEIWNETGRKVYLSSNSWYWDYYDSYSQSVNEVTFRFTLPTSGHSSIFLEAGYGKYNFSSDYSENTAVIGGGITMPVRSNWSWQTKLKIYPEKFETIVNLGASLTYNF
jgi:uncharacterized protein YaiE (UPF0345 family)